MFGSIPFSLDGEVRDAANRTRAAALLSVECCFENHRRPEFTIGGIAAPWLPDQKIWDAPRLSGRIDSGCP